MCQVFLLSAEYMYQWREQAYAYLPIVISAVCGINEGDEVIEDYGKAEALLHSKKLVWWEVTLKLRTEGALLANSLQEEGMPCSVNSWCMRSWKDAWRCPGGEWNEVWEVERDYVI